MSAPGSDPNDLTDKYNTVLDPQQEQLYQNWLQTLPQGQRSTYDYDMRGAFQAGASQAANGHFPDTFKKPNHPTFSVESKYSQGPMMGGKWVDNGNGTYKFLASPVNMTHFSPADLQQYFIKRESGNELVLPQ